MAQFDGLTAVLEFPATRAMGQVHRILLSVLVSVILVNTAAGDDYDILLEIRNGLDWLDGGTRSVWHF